MINENNAFRKNRSTGNFRRKFLFVSVVLGVILVLLGIHYRSHLLWKYVEWRDDLYSQNTIPDSPMPDVNIPEDWTEHSLGCLRFSAPPDFVVLPEKAGRLGKSPAIVLRNDVYRIVGMLLESPITFPDDIWAKTFKVEPLFVHNSKQTLTLPLPYLRLESCKSGADKFHWSMSPEDVAHNAVFIILRSVLAVDGMKSVETFSHHDVFGIALFKGRRALIDWQSTSATDAGFMHVFLDDDKQSEYDHVLVQRICQSFRVVDNAPEDFSHSTNEECTYPPLHNE